ncbi:MAG: acyl-CoA dehydrogenase family protein [Candidatus Helarchaeota archaeon]|nr:acyl-CoA dehydrogenase family protein [Candidatus Helarchaeota archaeon]
MTPKDSNPDFITYQDLNHVIGESMFPGSLYLYTDEENEFRFQLREFIQKEIAPLVPQIENEASFELCLEAYSRLGKAGYLTFSFPKSIGGQGKGYI